MTIGEKIKKFRLEKEMTQKELGEKSGLADSAIRRYELGGANPKFETIIKIAKALDVDFLELLDDYDTEYTYLKNNRIYKDKKNLGEQKIRNFEESINEFIEDQLNFKLQTFFLILAEYGYKLELHNGNYSVTCGEIHSDISKKKLEDICNQTTEYAKYLIDTATDMCLLRASKELEEYSIIYYSSEPERFMQQVIKETGGFFSSYLGDALRTKSKIHYADNLKILEDSSISMHTLTLFFADGTNGMISLDDYTFEHSSSAEHEFYVQSKLSRNDNFVIYFDKT